MYRFVSIITAGFFLFILWILYLANTGGNSIFFDLVHAVPFGDKVGHFFLFGILTLLFNLGLKFRYFNVRNFHLYIGTAIVSVFVILEEFSQGFVTTRTFDYRDLIADGMGIIVFTLISLYISRKHQTKGSI